MMQGVTVLGATGSIGVSTLDVVARHPERYRVVALTAARRDDRLLEQVLRFQPRLAVLNEADAAARLHRALRQRGVHGVEVMHGAAGLCEAAAHPDAGIVMAAIVGAAGLMPTLAAVRAGKRVLIANKEPLVMVGDLIMAEARRAGALLLPIDSEHNAIFQCLPERFSAGGANGTGLEALGVRRILLTGSGGPFRLLPLERLARVTPEEACAHPNWKMGPKISVDSATMMNKGLELIEACRLFATGPDRIEIVVHPQSVIHSMVEYNDGSVLAQLGNPDMRTPIAHALAWPERIDAGVAALDLFAVARLDFEPPDENRFPCLRLAGAAARAGGARPTVLNAANEEAVAAFLDHRLSFVQIPEVIEHTLERIAADHAGDLEAVLEADRAARHVARAMIAGQTRAGIGAAGA